MVLFINNQMCIRDSCYTLSFYDFDRIMQLKKKCKKSVGEKWMVKLDDMLDENSNDIIVCFYEKKVMI